MEHASYRSSHILVVDTSIEVAVAFRPKLDIELPEINP